MSDASQPLAAALQRLGAAIDLVDAAASRRLTADRNDAARAVELELMRGDRSRLAEELDQALARANALEGAQRDIAARVDRAIALVASALSEGGKTGR